MSRIKLLRAKLTVFDGDGGGGAASGTGANAGATTGEVSQEAAEKTKGDLSKVVYGKQSDTDSVKGQAGEGEADLQKKAQKIPFKDLINGEYKEEFDNIFQKRFKDHKDLQQKVTDQGAVLDILMSKYQITDGDLGKLTKAIEDDDSMWDSAAYDAGMTTDQYKQFAKLQRDNARLMQAEQARENEAKAQETQARLTAEANNVKQNFPDFDLATEIASTVDPETGRSRFVEMLSAGVDMETAYKAIHFNDLVNNAAKKASQATEKKVTDNIRAKGSRPVENGTSSQSAFTIKSDPTQWSKADRAEVIRRVARGERINL